MKTRNLTTLGMGPDFIEALQARACGLMDGLFRTLARDGRSEPGDMSGVLRTLSRGQNMSGVLRTLAHGK